MRKSLCQKNNKTILKKKINMSAIKFELKREHLLLLEHLSFSVSKNNIIQGVKDEIDNIAPPFGSDSIYEAIDLIINGKPKDIDPIISETEIEYSEEQKAEWDALYRELPTAMEIILSTKSFTLGNYKTLSYDKNWKLIPPQIGKSLKH